MKGAVLARCDDGEAGFSLVEVLVALLLVSMMAASLAAMTSQFREIARGTSRNIELSALQAAARHIARQVEQAEALRLDRVEPNDGFLIGKTNEIQFVATVRRGSHEQSLRTIEIGLRAGLGIVQINRFRRPNRDSSTDDDSELPVLDDVQALEFLYLGRDGPAGSSIWRESWDSADQLPIAVSVTLKKIDKTMRPMTSAAIAWLTPQ